MLQSLLAVDSTDQSRRAQFQRQYRPARVQVLFIGEAPPASGRFFYEGDSGLYRAMRDAFCDVDPTINDENFLARFQVAGCYLIDVCPYPVDQLDVRSRRAHCVANEPLLCRTIKKLEPQLMVTMVRAIRGNVERAASCAGWNGRVLDLPYPGRWIRHRNIFMAELVPELRALTSMAPLGK